MTMKSSPDRMKKKEITAKKIPMRTGKFTPDWESLQQYQTPKWFQDAKFGIWAHWGPQCRPEQGDWYARLMYIEGTSQYKHHIEAYGHPSTFGFKDVVNGWKAEKWDPDKLVTLYKNTGARYFFAMGNHHDNLDLWDSRYQEWNSVNVGPKKDILAGWAKAARKLGLPFGVSIHSSHAWTWYEPSRHCDRAGKFAGIPYDGTLSKADGKGKWWEGLDPQELYAQNHPLSRGDEDPAVLHTQWDWGNGATPPSEEYCLNFYNRTVDMIDTFHPDLIYFDDNALPLWPVSNAGLDIAAHFYNSSIALNNGTLKAVLFGKVLTDQQKRCMVWDVERGAPDGIQEEPWQSCSCIGEWHYKRALYENNSYKPSKTVVQMLVDIVSKNGNLLLNVPVRGDGTIDDRETAVLEGIAAWMKINGECIYDTRPWHIFGEGPNAEQANPIKAQGFNEDKGCPYTPEDIRFTRKGDILYAVIMDRPEKNEVAIRSLAAGSPYNSGKYKTVSVLGGHGVSYEFNRNGLTVRLTNVEKGNMPLVLKIF